MTMYNSSTARGTNVWRKTKKQSAYGRPVDNKTRTEAFAPAVDVKPISVTDAVRIKAFKQKSGCSSSSHDDPKKAPLNEQILEVASATRKQCQEQISTLSVASSCSTTSPQKAAPGTLKAPSLAIVNKLMEFVCEQVVVQLHVEARHTSRSLLKNLLTDTKRIGAWVRRMIKQHPVMFFIDRPTMLADLTEAVDNLYLSLLHLVSASATTKLTILWKQQLANLEHLMEQAHLEQDSIILDSKIPLEMQACLATADARAELLAVVQRKMKKLTKAATMDDDSATQLMATKSLSYLDQLLARLVRDC